MRACEMLNANANDPKHNKPRKFTLDCGHVLWLIIAPWKDDILWCKSCLRYEPLMLSVNSRHGRLIDPEGEFWSERKGKRIKGGCLYPTCTFVVNESTWDHVRNRLHEHYMRDHTRFGPQLEITVADRLPPNSPPPF